MVTRLILFFAFFILNSSFLIPNCSAQFWHAMPSLAASEQSASFSNDEKKVFWVSGGNIYNVVIADKYSRITATPGMTPVQITKFTDRPIVRAFHLTTRLEVIFVRLAENGKDYHLYRVHDDGSGSIEDLTPGDQTIELLGSSYNGRYVYYSSNKIHKDKVDVYRYDTQQFTSDLVFPNDKNWRVLAWTRDHARLLIENPESGELVLYDIVSTERKPLVKPANGTYLHAIMDPTNHELLVLEKMGNETVERSTAVGANAWKDVAKGDISWIDYSPNGKYVILEEAKKWAVRDIAGGSDVALPSGAKPIAIAPKETMLLYSLSDDGKLKLYLYDIAKKSSIEIATL